MALRFFDSINHYASATAPKKGWTFGAGQTTVEASLGRNGSGAIQVTTTAALPTMGASAPISGVSGTTAIVGFAFKVSAVTRDRDYDILTIFNGSTEQITVTLSLSGTLSVRRGTRTGTVLGTTATTLGTATWYFLELKVLFSDTVGTYDLKIDGTSAVSGSSADTVVSGAAWSGIAFRIQSQNAGSGNQPTFLYGDVYVCDGSGGSENDFLGDHAVDRLLPSTGNGTNTAWSLSTGSDHGALVDENPMNESDYVYTSTINAVDTFNYPAMALGGTVKAVQVVLFAKAAVAGVRQLTATCVISGTTYAHGTPQVLGSDWTCYRFVFLVSPATGIAWTTAEIDGAEFGAKVAA